MNSVLLVIGSFFVAIAAVIHLYIFFLESIAWRRPRTWNIFGIASQQEADTIAPMAFNQGFYNLFLAVGCIVGFILLPSVLPAGIALIFMGSGSMVLASAVLLSSSRSNLRSAALQGTAPLIGVVLLALSFA